MVWEFHQSLNNLYSAEPAVLALSYHIGHLSHGQARPAYKIGSRMIIYLTDEDSDGMKSQFFPSCRQSLVNMMFYRSAIV